MRLVFTAFVAVSRLFPCTTIGPVPSHHRAGFPQEPFLLLYKFAYISWKNTIDPTVVQIQDLPRNFYSWRRKPRDTSEQKRNKIIC